MSPENQIKNVSPLKAKRSFAKVTDPRVLILFILMVSVVVAAVHWPVLSSKALTFDDHQYLTENVLVQKPGLGSAARFLSEILTPSTVKGYYQPLNMISLMLDYAMGGRADNLMPFHRTSLILHVFNTGLVIVLLYLLFGNGFIAAGVGLLFGIHPMTIEAIAWVGERKTVLAAFFSFCCLVLYVLYTRRKDCRFYLCCLLMYLLAVMSKPTSIALPLVMLVMDFWPLNRLTRAAVYEKIPFFIVCGFSAVVTYISQAGTHNVSLPGEYGPGRIPLVLCHNIIFYLCKILWPVNLSNYYAFPKPLNFSDPMIAIGVIGTCILLPLLIISLRWTRSLFTGWLIFFITALPTMQIIGFSQFIAADKFAYLPSIGFLITLAWAFSRLFRLAKKNIVPAAAVILILLSAGLEARATRIYLVKWGDTKTLMEHMLTKTPDSGMLHNELGLVYKSLGQPDKALECYKRAVELEPRSFHVYNNIAILLKSQGRFDEARKYYLKSIELQPDSVYANYNLGLLAKEQGNSDEAIIYFRKALASNAEDAEVRFELGSLLLGRKNFEEAILHFREAVDIKPDFVSAHYNLANALYQQDKLDEAVNHFRKVIQLKKDSVYAHNNLGSILASKGQYDRAIVHYQTVLQIDPNSTQTYRYLGAIFFKSMKDQKAIYYYSQYLKRNPDNAEIYNNLALALSRSGNVEGAIKSFRRAIELKPDFMEAYHNLGIRLFRKGRLESAIRHFRKAQKLAPDDTEVKRYLDAVLREHKRITEAIDYFEDVITAYPKEFKAHNDLAQLYAGQGRYDLAIKHMNASLKSEPNQIEVYNNLASAYYNQKNLDKTKEYLTESLRLNSDQPEVYRKLGVLSCDRKNFTEAMEYYVESIRLRPKQISLINQLAEFHLVRDNTEQAIRYFTDSLTFKNNQPAVLNSLAWIKATNSQQQFRDPVKALEYAQKACELTKFDVAGYLDTLAAALAANEKFTDALEIAKKAIALLDPLYPEDQLLAEEIKTRLKLYTAGQGYFERPGE